MENELTVIATYTLAKIGLVAFLAMYAYRSLVLKTQPQKIRKSPELIDGPGRGSSQHNFMAQ